MTVSVWGACPCSPDGAYPCSHHKKLTTGSTTSRNNHGTDLRRMSLQPRWRMPLQPSRFTRMFVTGCASKGAYPCSPDGACPCSHPWGMSLHPRRRHIPALLERHIPALSSSLFSEGHLPAPSRGHRHVPAKIILRGMSLHPLVACRYLALCCHFGR